MNQRQHSLALLLPAAVALLPMCAQAAPRHRYHSPRHWRDGKIASNIVHSDHWPNKITVVGIIKQGHFAATNDTNNLLVGQTYVIQVTTSTDPVPPLDSVTLHPIQLTFFNSVVRPSVNHRRKILVLTQAAFPNPTVTKGASDKDNSYRRFNVTFVSPLPNGQSIADANRLNVNKDFTRTFYVF